MLLQAQLPRQHLAAQAPAGASVVQQLNALGKLHARIRQGETAVAAELSMSEPADLPPNCMIDIWACKYSPAAGCGLLAWGDREQDADGHDHPSSTAGACVVGSADGVPWTCAHPSVAPLCYMGAGFSTCGRFCVVLAEPQAGQGSKAVDELVAIRVYDTCQRLWLPDLHLGDFWQLSESRIAFSTSICPPLAAARVHGGAAGLEDTDEETDALVVLVLASMPSVSIFDTGNFNVHLWLPGTPSLMLMRVTSEETSLARVNFGPGVGCTGAVIWMLLPGLPRLTGGVCMAASACGEALWVAGSVELQQNNGQACLAVCSLASLQCINSWRRTFETGTLVDGVQVCKKLLAVHIAQPTEGGGVVVYSLSGDILGQELYRVSAYSTLSFTPDGRFAAMDENTTGGVVCLLDTRDWTITGDLDPPLSADEDSDHTTSSSEWVQGDGSQLLIRYKTENGQLLFRTLQF